MSRRSPEEGCGCGDCDEGFGDAGELFVVTREASALHDPCEGSLDDPAAAQDDEPFHPGHAPDDLQRDVSLVLGPCDEAPGIAAVREDGFHEGKAGAGPLQHTLGAVAVLNVGSVDLDRQQTAVGVGQDVAFAPVSLLARIITFESPF